MALFVCFWHLTLHAPAIQYRYEMMGRDRRHAQLSIMCFHLVMRKQKKAQFFVKVG
jgi:hypothetical protein